MDGTSYGGGGHLRRHIALEWAPAARTRATSVADCRQLGAGVSERVAAGEALAFSLGGSATAYWRRLCLVCRARKSNLYVLAADAW